MPLPSDRALSARPSDHNRIGDHRVLASTSKRFACRPAHAQRFHGCPPEETSCLVNGIGIVKVKGSTGGLSRCEGRCCWLILSLSTTKGEP